MRRVLLLAMLCLIITGCSLLTVPDQPGSPAPAHFMGQVVTGDQPRPLPTAKVKIDEHGIPLDALARFSASLPAVETRTITVTAAGYRDFQMSFAAGADLNFTQIAMERAAPAWDFSTTKLIGWSDPVSGAYYYTDKFRAITEDTSAHGSNCLVVNADRSWGLQYHDGNCGARNHGWWSHIHNDGYEYQFGTEFQSCFQNIHKSSEVNQRWLDLMESRVQIAEDSGQWAIVNLWCPYDDKWYGVDWYFWTPDCSMSPYIDGNRYYTDWQKIATLALVERLKDHTNVIWTDNWEEAGYFGSVNLRWKKLVYQWVRSLSDAPYFVYVGDHLANRAETIAWINATPDIAGLHSHYITGKTWEDFGLSHSKRLLCTEEADLGPGATYRGIQWAQETGAEVCMYFGSYRDFMNTDGSPDIGKPDRDSWYPRIDELLGR